MKELKTTLLVSISGIILGLTMGVFLLNILTHKETIEYVSGYEHIYKGQVLSKDYIFEIESLSSRASYLNTTQYFDSNAKNNLEQMILDAEKDGMCLVVMSGYRSSERQEIIYDEAENKSLVALPNQSEHQTGLAVDFGACPMKDGIRDDSVERLELRNDFIDLPEYCWLVRNAYKYGFEQSFTEYNKYISGYPSESWHWKFIIK